MLQVIRKQVHGILGWFIMGLIIMSFALWGISSYIDGGEEIPIATVGNTKFYQKDVNRAYLRLKQSNPQYAALDENVLRKEAIRQLVSDTVLGDTVHDINLEVGDQSVKKIIQDIDVFKVEGKFDKKTYTLALNSQGLSSRQFIEQTRLAMAKDQLRRSSLDSGFATETELNGYFKLFNQSREVEYVNIPVTVTQIQHSDENIQAYYKEHADRYQVPEQVSLQYVELNLDDLAAQEEVTDEGLLTYYEEQKDSFTTEERRKVKHILISTKNDDSDAGALKKAQDIQQKLIQGENFTDLAKQLSEDPLSKKKGGDLGFIRHGDMVKEFEDAAFGLAQGVNSEPVKTEYGYHILQVTAIESAKSKSFEEVKEQLTKDYRRKEAENKFFELQDTLDQVRYENSGSLDMAAEAIGKDIQETGLFNQQIGVGIATEQAVRDIAFSNDVLEGNNSEIIELGSERVVVVRVKEHQPTTIQPLETVKQGVIQALNQKAAHEAAVSKADGIVKALNEGQSLDQLAKARGLELENPGFIARNDTKIPWQIKQGIFSTAKPTDKPTIEKIDLGAQGQVVIMIKSVKDGDADTVTDDERDEAKARLVKSRNSIEYTALISQLEQASDVSIQDDLQ
jgi:peptidyl-prolyl cis-trans isomerase D